MSTVIFDRKVAAKTFVIKTLAGDVVVKGARFDTSAGGQLFVVNAENERVALFGNWICVSEKDVT